MRGTLIRFEWIWADHVNRYPLYESYFWITQTDNEYYWTQLKLQLNWLHGDDGPQWIMTDFDGDPETYTSRKVQRLIKVYTIEEEDIEL